MLQTPQIPSAWELVAEALDPQQKRNRWESPLAMATALDPSVLRTPALNLIDEALVKASRTQDARLIISMPPQQGKSQTAVRRYATWLLSEDPTRKIVVASYEHNVARRWGRQIRDDIIDHSDALGLKVRPDISAQQEWEIFGHSGGVFSTGVGGGLTGRKASVMIIDDPVKDAAQAASKKQRDTIYSWWDTVSQTRLEPGAPVIVIMTRWHQDDLAGRLITDYGDAWTVLNIPAEADHRPEKGETDPLGREPGEWLESVQVKAKPDIDNDEWWENRKAGTSPHTWAAMYQGRPSPQQGGVFPATDEWAYYEEPMWDEDADGTCKVRGKARADVELVQSWDLTFKDSKSSDYVVGQVWLRVGTKAYLVDMVRGQWDFTESVRQIYKLSKKWPQATAKFIEDKANGPAVINYLRRNLSGLIPIEPEGSKFARANSISPYVHSGDVLLPNPENKIFRLALRRRVRETLNEALDFPHSSHDDTIDAMSQAVNRLLSMPVHEIDPIVEPEPQRQLARQGWSISPF